MARRFAAFLLGAGFGLVAGAAFCFWCLIQDYAWQGEHPEGSFGIAPLWFLMVPCVGIVAIALGGCLGIVGDVVFEFVKRRRQTIGCAKSLVGPWLPTDARFHLDQMRSYGTSANLPLIVVSTRGESPSTVMERISKSDWSFCQDDDKNEWLLQGLIRPGDGTPVSASVIQSNPREVKLYFTKN